MSERGSGRVPMSFAIRKILILFSPFFALAFIFFCFVNLRDHGLNISKWGCPETPQICLNGVVYYRFREQITPRFGKDSEVVTCDENGTIEADNKITTDMRTFK